MCVLDVEVIARALAKDVGEHNFQSEGDRYKENITLSLHYMVSMCKGRRKSLVDNHIMGNVQKMGNVG